MWRLYFLFIKPRRPKLREPIRYRQLNIKLSQLFEKQISDDYVFLLNERGEFSWNDQSKSKLWLYNLNYFNFVCSADSLHWKTKINSLIEDWSLTQCCASAVGWEPYPLSLRAVNWVKWISYNRWRAPSSVIQSLYEQLELLSRRPEKHLLGNHLFANGKALIFGGMFFDTPRSRVWLEQGLRIIEDELLEQVLMDGGSFELSPMYHNIMIYDVLDLYNLATSADCPRLRQLLDNFQPTLLSMFAWADAMSHSDGEVSFFNDSSVGVAPSILSLGEYARIIGFDPISLRPHGRSICKLVNLIASGFVVVEEANFKLLFDCGRVGPDYIPGHAHADTLALELSVAGSRLFVNSGTSEYAQSELRSFQRGSSAHNTVTVNDVNSSDVWASFRVGRRAQGVLHRSVHDGNVSFISASHDGYKELFGVTHTREIKCSSNQIDIIDILDTDTNDNFQCTARYYLDPAVRIIEQFQNTVTLEVAGTFVELESNVTIVIARAWHYPQFNKKSETNVLSMSPDMNSTELPKVVRVNLKIVGSCSDEDG